MKILFVDDDPLTVRALVHTFAVAYAWEAEGADGGEAALAAIARTAFDVIVTDLEMPGIDGREVLAVTRRLRPQALRVLLTGCELASGELDAHVVIGKPCLAAQLHAVIVQARGASIVK